MTRRTVSWVLSAVAGLTIVISSIARPAKTSVAPPPVRAAASAGVVKDGEYTSKDDVAPLSRSRRGSRSAATASATMNDVFPR